MLLETLLNRYQASLNVFALSAGCPAIEPAVPSSGVLDGEGHFSVDNNTNFTSIISINMSYLMKNYFLSCLGLCMGLATNSHAQFSAGGLLGVGHLWERRDNAGFTLSGVDAAQPVLAAGLYGQFVSKGKVGLLAGLQLRYQTQHQSQRFAIPATNPTGPIELSEPAYNHYRYITATPYLGIRLVNRLDLAAGPELSALLSSQLASFNREPAKATIGYNLKLTYWLGRFGIEGGYSQQTSAFDNEAGTKFYNRYAYGLVKYNLFGPAR